MSIYDKIVLIKILKSNLYLGYPRHQMHFVFYKKQIKMPKQEQKTHGGAGVAFFKVKVL